MAICVGGLVAGSYSGFLSYVLTGVCTGGFVVWMVGFMPPLFSGVYVPIGWQHGVLVCFVCD